MAQYMIFKNIYVSIFSCLLLVCRSMVEFPLNFHCLPSQGRLSLVLSSGQETQFLFFVGEGAEIRTVFWNWCVLAIFFPFKILC